MKIRENLFFFLIRPINKYRHSKNHPHLLKTWAPKNFSTFISIEFFVTLSYYDSLNKVFLTLLTWASPVFASTEPNSYVRKQWYVCVCVW